MSSIGVGQRRPRREARSRLSPRWHRSQHWSMLHRQCRLTAAFRLFDLGDPVNVASRLQDATKIYGLPIIAGEQTAAAAPELAFLEIDTMTLRGKGRPERIFALLGDATVARTERFGSLRTAIDVLIGALLANDRTAAQTKLEECGALDWRDLGRCSRSTALA